MKFKLFIIFSLIFISFFFINVRAGETPLQPAEQEFLVSPIYFPKGEIVLSGNKTHLSTYWEAYYSDGSWRDVGAVCFLNCDEEREDCSSAQNCSTLTPVGKGVCSIVMPNYPSLTEKNNVTCRFYDPFYPDTTKGYLNKSFTPVNFSFWFSDYSSVVGEEFNLPVNIINYGLFTDTYQIEAETNKPTVVRINPQTLAFTAQIHGDAFDPHVWNQTGPGTKQVYIKIIILDVSEPSTILCVNVSSSFGDIEKRNCVGLKSNYKIMSELNTISLMVLSLIAAIFIFKFKIK